MIDQQMVSRLSGAVCSVGYLKGPPQTYASDRNIFVVIGTGFLVREMTVVINRHVLQKLRETQSQMGFDNSQRCLSFVRPGRGSGEVKEAFRTIKSYGFVGNLDLDIGFVDITRPPGEEFQDWVPLKVAESVCISTPAFNK